MGDVDSELVFDLSMVIMDKISFKASTWQTGTRALKNP
jgi:hypothetical protein